MNILNNLAQTLTYNGPRVADGETGTAAIMTLVFGALGAISVIVIILAGLQLIINGDNPQAVAKAKNTIIYAAIGIAVALSAIAIVQLVVWVLA